MIKNNLISQEKPTPNYSVEETYFTIDKAIEFVGDNSKYQKQVIVIFSIQWILFSFFIMGLPLQFAQPKFFCLNQATNTTYRCDEAVACKNPDFIQIDEINSPNSIAQTFNLFCSRKSIEGASGALFFTGASAAGFFFPQFSQIKGRKLAIEYCIIISGVSIIIAGISINTLMFMVCIFFAGFGLNGYEIISLVYVTEVSAEKFRNMSTIILTVTWSMAQIIFPTIHVYIDNWRLNYVCVIGIPLLISYILTKKFILETPRWLVSKSRYTEAKEILSMISVINSRPKVRYRLEGENDQNELIPNQKVEDQDTLSAMFGFKYLGSQNYTYVDLFRYLSLRRLTIFMVLLWIFRYSTYFGQVFALSIFGADIKEIMIMMGVAEIIANLLVGNNHVDYFLGPIKLRNNRIQSMSFFALITTISCFIIFIIQIPEKCYSEEVTCIQKILEVLFQMVVKFSISSYASILITYTSEIFPTQVRSLGYGLCMTSGKIGTILMPLVVAALQMRGINPLLISGLFGIIIIYIIQKFLEETKDKPLKDYIKENEKIDHPIIQMTDFNFVTKKQSNLSDY